MAGNSNCLQPSPYINGAAQRSTVNWAECLPNFSARIQDVLDRGKVIEDWDCFVSECAYHVIAFGDMRTSADYCEFGQAIIRRYPCVSTTDGNQPWVKLHYTYLMIAQLVLRL